MNAPQQKALSLGEQYGVDVSAKLEQVKHLTTIGEIAEAVLPRDAYLEWLGAAFAEGRRLRQKYDKKPYDKFDAEYRQAIGRAQMWSG